MKNSLVASSVSHFLSITADSQECVSPHGEYFRKVLKCCFDFWRFFTCFNNATSHLCLSDIQEILWNLQAIGDAHRLEGGFLSWCLPEAAPLWLETNAAVSLQALHVFYLLLYKKCFESLAFQALSEMKYYCVPFTILNSLPLKYCKSAMLNVLRRLRSSFLILHLAELICNPFRVWPTFGDGGTRIVANLHAALSEIFRISPWLSTFILLINLHRF